VPLFRIVSGAISSELALPLPLMVRWRPELLMMCSVMITVVLLLYSTMMMMMMIVRWLSMCCWQPLSFGFESGEPGCELCACGEAAVDRHCDSVTGQCQCRTGVTGRRCDMCDDGYWNYGPRGCQRMYTTTLYILLLLLLLLLLLH